MSVSALEPRLQKFGISSNGSTQQVVLIGPVLIASVSSGFNNGNIPYLREWSGTAALGSSSTYMQLQISNDGLVWTTIDHLELVNAGMVKQTYGKPIPICAPGQRFQVIGIQATGARMTTSMFGFCTLQDIVDL